MLNNYIQHLMAGNNLSQEESSLAAKLILSDAADPIAIGVFLTLLHAKGETVAEIVGFHHALMSTSRRLNLTQPVLDIVGTGGDKSGSLNISSGGALLSAACGVAVVKHGNGSISSKCGSADVLAELGYPLNLSDAGIAQQLDKSNFAFCFAHNYYPVLKKLSTIRKQLATPTIFNLLGPLLNPVGREHVILGVYKPEYVNLIAEVLFKLGTLRSLVFHGNGLDELSCLGPITAKLIDQQGIQDLVIDPEQLGLSLATLEDLAGHDRAYNAHLLRQTLNGIHSGISDSLILNAAAGLLVVGKAPSLAAGVIVARQRLGAGAIVPMNKLQQIVDRKYQVPVPRKSMRKALLSTPFAVISEIKRASPSAGVIAVIEDPLACAKNYIAAGAVAISVLTDAGFDGSMADLKQVALGLKDTPIPVLCKDFFLTPPQIAAAAAAGADVILLIVHLLKEETSYMAKVAHSFGLEVLIEVHTCDELALALQADADIIGVNQRDLNDFSLHPEVFAALIKAIPEGQVKVAESGLKTRDQAVAVLELGYDGVLVGEALSRLANPADFFHQHPALDRSSNRNSRFQQR